MKRSAEISDNLFRSLTIQQQWNSTCLYVLAKNRINGGVNHFTIMQFNKLRLPHSNNSQPCNLEAIERVCDA